MAYAITKEEFVTLRPCKRAATVKPKLTLHWTGLGFELACRKRQSLFRQKVAACHSARTVRRRRPIRTFTGRDVCSPTHMSPENMEFIFFRRCGGETLRGFIHEKYPRRSIPSGVWCGWGNQEIEMRAMASSLVPSSSVAVMVQVFLPVPTALTVPLELTVTTLVLLLVHVTVPV